MGKIHSNSASSRANISKMSSVVMYNIPNRPKFLIFIKPWDDSVFQNFLILLSSIDRTQKEMEITIDIIVP